jgi:hypothetical protein
VGKMGIIWRMFDGLVIFSQLDGGKWRQKNVLPYYHIYFVRSNSTNHIWHCYAMLCQWHRLALHEISIYMLCLCMCIAFQYMTWDVTVLNRLIASDCCWLLQDDGESHTGIYDNIIHAEYPYFPSILRATSVSGWCPNDWLVSTCLIYMNMVHFEENLDDDSDRSNSGWSANEEVGLCWLVGWVKFWGLVTPPIARCVIESPPLPSTSFHPPTQCGHTLIRRKLAFDFAGKPFEFSILFRPSLSGNPSFFNTFQRIDPSFITISSPFHIWQCVKTNSTPVVHIIK